MRRCLRCGAQNPAAAEWCTLCLARFDEPSTPPDDEPDEEIAGELAALAEPDLRVPTLEPEVLAATPPSPVRDVPVRFVQRGDRVQWVCPACETPNDVEESACRICGTVLARAFAATTPEEPPRTKPAGTAMALSAVLPGLGHAYAGMIPAALGRLGLYAWTVTIAVLFLARPPVRARAMIRGVGLVFALAAAAVWVLALVESRRFATGDRTPIVPPRSMMWMASGLTFVLFLGLTAAAFSRG